MIHSSRKPVPPTRFQKFAKKSAETSAIPLLIVAFALAFAVHFVVRPVMFVLSVVPTLLVRASGEPMNWGKDKLSDDLKENWYATREAIKDIL